MTKHMIEAGKPATRLKSEALAVLLERGLVHQCTDVKALDKRLSEGPVTAYAGFDATAASLHVGHLMPLMTMRWLQKLGHRPIVVLGGGTSQIGDPSFRKDARPLLEERQIAANIATIRRSVERLVDMDGPDGALLVDNAQWLNEFRFLEFLRDYGSQFTVNRMMTFDSVRSRLEAQMPLTVLEFCYMMLQAVDFLELAKRHDCVLQVGGSDQWGNIVNGVELGRRDGRKLHGLTVPLLPTASGAKMGKTAAGAVWLHPEHLSPFGFWQFWRNTADADVGKCLRLFTELPISEVERLSALQGAELNEAKKILATQITAIVHGPEEARARSSSPRTCCLSRVSRTGLVFWSSLSPSDLPPRMVRPGVWWRAELCVSTAGSSTTRDGALEPVISRPTKDWRYRSANAARPSSGLRELERLARQRGRSGNDDRNQRRPHRFLPRSSSS